MTRQEQYFLANRCYNPMWEIPTKAEALQHALNAINRAFKK